MKEEGSRCECVPLADGIIGLGIELSWPVSLSIKSAYTSFD
jgi:hypothetical protein